MFARFSAPRVLMLGVVVCTAGVLYIGFSHVRASPPPMRAIEACNARPDAVACAGPIIAELVRTTSVKDIFDSLSDTFSPSQCHYFGHVVGEDLYRTYKSVEQALASCVPTCGDACVHGVIGEAFVEEAGIDDSTVDPAHLSMDEILSIGSKLCTTRNTCHGVGHALFLSSHSIESASQACHRIGTEYLGECEWGVFMEYSDELASRSAWDNSTTTHPDLAASPPFCVRSSLIDTEACFFYFPQMVYQTLASEGGAPSRAAVNTRVQRTCESLADLYQRRACAYGLGASFFQPVLGGSRGAANTCDLFTGEDDRLACVLGLVSMVTEYHATGAAFGVCAAQSDVIAPTCYQTVFARLYQLGQSPSQAALQCPVGSDACLAASARNGFNPLKTFLPVK